MGYNSVTNIMGRIFILLAIGASQNRELSRENPIKFDLTAVQGHPRSSENSESYWLFSVNSFCF